MNQTLWIKASEILHAKCMNIVFILRSFHAMMSFPGSIGYLMSGSGLAKSLETPLSIYFLCGCTIKHMSTGKTIARVLRGHFLVKPVLQETLMPPFLLINKNSTNTEVESNDKAPTDRNNQNVIYDQIETDEDAICGE